MSKIFLATSFSDQVNYTTGAVVPEYRAYVEGILATLRTVGFEVFSAIEHEGWAVSDQPPEVGVTEDLAEIEQADIFLAVLHDLPSAGVQYQMGHACGLGKSILMAHSFGTDLAYFNRGLVNLGYATDISFSNAKNLAKRVLSVAAPTPTD